jgi:hypothetical protein
VCIFFIQSPLCGVFVVPDNSAGGLDEVLSFPGSQRGRNALPGGPEKCYTGPERFFTTISGFKSSASERQYHGLKDVARAG